MSNGNQDTNGGDATNKRASFLKDRENDIRVREQIKQKDSVSIEQVKKDLAEEEKELKQFFDGNAGKKNEAEDPTVLRKKRYEEKMGAYREAIDGLNIREMARNFWTYQPPTPEEIETLEDCRRFTKRNILTYAILGVTFTTFVSIYKKNVLGWGLRLFGFGTGVVGGGIYGIISSTEYTLRRLEGLGPDYSLGRMAINEIEDFRMDKKKFNRV